MLASCGRLPRRSQPRRVRLDGHEGSVDVGERVLERSEVCEGRCAHRRDGLALGLDGSSGRPARRVGMVLWLAHYSTGLKKRGHGGSCGRDGSSAPITIANTYVVSIAMCLCHPCFFWNV